MIDSGGESSPNSEHQRGFIEKIKVTTLLGRPDEQILTSSAFKAALPTIERTFKETGVWHGTGRYQYDPADRSQVRDVLKTIVTEDALVPHTDVLDITRGRMESISTSPAWAYSLMYAQWHYEKGKSFFDYSRNGLICAYYTTPIVWRILTEALIHKNPDYVQMLNRTYRKDFLKLAGGFSDKYTKTRSSKLDMPKGGQSNISGNYPILIGIRQDSFVPTSIARALDKHEMRSETPITMNNFTHIEVPEDKVQEVTDYLHKHGKNIPVYPIEWGIEYAKSLPLDVILDGKK